MWKLVRFEHDPSVLPLIANEGRGFAGRRVLQPTVGPAHVELRNLFAGRLPHLS